MTKYLHYISFFISETGVLVFDESVGVVTHFIKLCPDPSLLGDRLLDVVTSLLDDEDLLSPKGIFPLFKKL